jgi:hypothetical protein
MSDIYLQITETPTVVTLSAPVISGALSSTVTVANTVTVALDSNSLSALENVTVTVGAAITGTVTVSNSVTIGSLPAISGTVTANGIAFNSGEATPDKAVWIAYNLNNTLEGVSDSTPLPISGTVTVGNFPASQAVTFSAVTISNFPSTQTIAGAVTANVGDALLLVGGGYSSLDELFANVSIEVREPSYVTSISGTVTIGAGTAQIGSVTVGNSVTIGSLPSLVAGTAQIGVVTIGNIRRSGDGALSQLSTEAGSNYLQTVVMPGTSQIGSVTASISGTVPVSISSVTVGNSVTIGSLPAISGTVTANTFALQGTAVTTSNFTSTTASTVLASFNATREVLTIFNEGAGNLHVSVGATCTTVQYQVRLSAGDYYEAPNHQTTITHSAVFATAGTARVTQVS